jgi:hypothetical protein
MLQHSGMYTDPRTAYEEKLMDSSCLICVFLATLEIAIVSTALVAITDDLESFGKSSWIITSYLLTWTGMSEHHVLRCKSQ